jgi:hypothetical protein
MANEKISALATLTGADVETDDLLVIVDVHDTTMASSGTDKKLTVAALLEGLALAGGPGKFTGTLGDGTTKVFTITHNLGNQWPAASFYETSDGEAVIPDVVGTDDNTLTVTFSVAPSSDSIDYTIVG